MTGLDDAAARLDQAQAQHYRAEALAELAQTTGVRLAALDPGQVVFGVACDGVLVGEIRPAWPGRQLGGWTAYCTDGTRLPGEFRTGRAAAAALAAEDGVALCRPAD